MPPTPAVAGATVLDDVFMAVAQAHGERKGQSSSG